MSTIKPCGVIALLDAEMALRIWSLEKQQCTALQGMSSLVVSPLTLTVVRPGSTNHDLYQWLYLFYYIEHFWLWNLPPPPSKTFWNCYHSSLRAMWSCRGFLQVSWVKFHGPSFMEFSECRFSRKAASFMDQVSWNSVSVDFWFSLIAAVTNTWGLSK